MMESVLDGNDNNEFCSKEYALIEIDNLEGNAWEGDKQTAEKIITSHAKDHAIIIRIHNKEISLNQMALAFFAESITSSNSVNNI